ncbi:MAG: hypothetical protein IPL79_12605 [Myxococcales bacterium]|nr:hypothetical protein [Myxococcales bacterium]
MSKHMWAGVVGVVGLMVLGGSVAAEEPGDWARDHDDYVTFSTYATGNHSALINVELRMPWRAKRRAKPIVERLATLGVDHQRSQRALITWPKKTIWSGIGNGDAVLVATKDGTLWRAVDVNAAAAATFVKVANISRATTWDANAATNIVVAGAGKTLYVSHDGGGAFTPFKLKRRIEGVFVRADGVIAVDLKGAPPQSSRDGGKTWQVAPAALRDLKLVREGNLIGQALDTGEGVRAACRNGVLAADGMTWKGWTKSWEHTAPKADAKRDIPGGTEDSQLDDWDDKFSSWAAEFTSWPSALAATPLQPKHEVEHAELTAACRQRGGGGFGIGSIGFIGSPSAPAGCVGIDCVANRYPSHRSIRLRFDTLGDGECLGQIKDGMCQGTIKRPATIYAVDQGRKTIALATPPCEGMRHKILLEGGVGLAQCAANHEVQALGSDGQWRVLGLLDFPIRTAEVGPTGAIVLRDDCYANGASCGYVATLPATRDGLALTPSVRGQYLRDAMPLANGNVLITIAVPQADDRTWIFLERNEGWTADAKARDKPRRPAHLTDRLSKLADCFKESGTARVAGEVKVAWDGTKTTFTGTNTVIEQCAHKVLGRFPGSLPPGDNTIFFRQYHTLFDVVERTPAGAEVRAMRGLRLEGELNGVYFSDKGELRVRETIRQPAYLVREWQFDAGLGALIPVAEAK